MGHTKIMLERKKQIQTTLITGNKEVYVFIFLKRPTKTTSAKILKKDSQQSILLKNIKASYHRQK